MNNTFRILSLLIAVLVLISACIGANAIPEPGDSNNGTGKVIEYAFVSKMVDGKMAFIGSGGSIDGAINPTLSASMGDTLKVTLTSGEGVEHNISFPDFNAMSEGVAGEGSSTTLEFIVDKAGSFTYICAIPGHKEAGMLGRLEVTGGIADNPDPATPPVNNNGSAGGPVIANNPATRGADIVRDPMEVPAPIGSREPQTIRIDLETIEIEGQLADGATFMYWTFNGKVPGPFYRVRVGDTIEIHLRNLTNSTMAHSVDFHAVTGPGGGAVMTQTAPGKETTFTARVINPGLYVYHCTTPMVPQHIANGMYGLILVEPEAGLPAVDREFYVMQGELYTNEAFGSTGLLTENIQALLYENPEYLVFNGAVGSLTNVQTTTVPAGGATMVEFGLEVPGEYILVDHALSRSQRGLVAHLIAAGAANPEIFNSESYISSGH